MKFSGQIQLILVIPTFPLAPYLGQNFKLSDTLVSDQMAAELKF